jgi:hypothetical protein
MFAEVYLAVRFSCGKSLGAKNSGQRPFFQVENLMRELRKTRQQAAKLGVP